MSLPDSTKAKVSSEASQPTDWNERVVLNIGGKRFETYAHTLAGHPDTLLGAMFSDRNKSIRHHDKDGEYFFDRDPEPFQVILNFYRTGKIFLPPHANENLYHEEFLFFQIPITTNSEQKGVWTFGRGEYGQLGHGDRCNVSTPHLIEAWQGVNIRQISLGTSHTAAVTDDFRVFTWGYGGDGRLGHGEEDDVLIPKLVESLSEQQIIQVECGELHTAALTKNGRVFTWGLGKDGRLGHANRESCFTPQCVESLRNYEITQVSCGGLHTAVLTSNGQLLSFGLGKNGRLGHGTDADRVSPQLIQCLARTGTIITQVLCGGHHTAALTESGKVLTWGFDDDGRLGHNCTGHVYSPKTVSALQHKKIVQISCGCWHSAALSEEGEVFTWGSCKSGQLGQAHKTSVPSPKVVLVGKGGGIKAIACGTAHTAALTVSGEVYTWGKCDDGRLGYETTTDQSTPRLVDTLTGQFVEQIVCGVYHTAVLTRS